METPQPTIEERDVVYGMVEGRELRLDILRPAQRPRKPAAAVVYVHGGGWAGGERIHHVNHLLAPFGFVTVSIAYRFSQEAPFPAQIHDVKTAIRWLRRNAGELGVHPDRIGIWGHSAGGHLAALAALTGNLPELEGPGDHQGFRTDVQVAVPMSAPVWFPPDNDWSLQRAVTQLLGGSPAQHEALTKLASPLHHVGPGKPPLLVIQGMEDDLVPPGHATLLVNALRAHGNRADAFLLERAGHDQADMIDPPYWLPDVMRQTILEYFREFLD